MDSLSKEIQIDKSNQIILLELKNTITNKNLVDFYSFSGWAQHQSGEERGKICELNNWDYSNWTTEKNRLKNWTESEGPVGL